MSWSKIHAMGLSKNEKLLYAGNSGGEILILDVEQFKIIQRIQAHAGTVVTIFAHPVLPFVASLSKDRTAKLWRIKDDRLTLLHTFNSREDAGDADAEKYNPIHSTSQALAFHPIEARVVWRAGTGAIVEVEFTDETYKVLRRFRASPMNGVAQIWYDLETQGIFCATIKGDLVLMKDGVHMRSWKFFDETIHWMEPIGKNRYLLAGDSRRMIDFNSVNSDLTRIGEAFARDDFEHVTQCALTKRTYASSFDRNIYEIDMETLTAKRVVWKAPFKCRWIRTLKSDPSQMIVQCRNGGLYKINVETGEVIAKIKETPNALWTSVTDSKGRLFISGEGNTLTELRFKSSRDQFHMRLSIDQTNIPQPSTKDSYTKRMVIQESTNLIGLGRTDGQLLFGNSENLKELTCFKSAIRDLSLHPKLPIIFAACEDGHIFKIDTVTGQTLASFKSDLDLPIWAISLDPTGRYLGASERMGRFLLLSTDSSNGKLSVEFSAQGHRFSKRMKWFDENTLLFGASGIIKKFDLSKREITSFSPDLGNSMEDFVWDKEKNHMLAITYNRELFLLSPKTGAILSRVHDQMDYSKGVSFIPCTSANQYPLQFITYGRTGVPKVYKIHDDQILAEGELHVN